LSQKLLEDSGKLRQAKEEIARLGDLAGPNCGLCLLQLAQIEHEVGNRDQAIATTRTAVALNGPRELAARAYNQLGSLLIAPDAAEPRLLEADRDLRRAVELGDGTAKFNLAALRLRLKDPAEALELARQYIAAAPTSRTARQARVVVCDARAALPQGVAGSAVSDSPPMEVSHGVTKPVVVRQKWAPFKPAHSGTWASYADQGVAKIEAVIDEEGCVLEARATGKDPDIEQPAVVGARGWVFEPATYQGKAVRVKTTLYFDYGHLISPQDPLLSKSGVDPN